jgi:LPS export ABC transporter protein LptC
MILVRRILLWAVPGVLIVALAWSFFLHGGPPREGRYPSPAPGAASAPPPPATATPSGTIRLGNLVGTDDRGRTRWRITAADVTLEEGAQVVLLRGIHATFYDPDGTTMAVTGERGQYGIKTQEVNFEGNVHGLSSGGREVFADRLDYSPSSGTVMGTGHVRVIEERVIMYADRMISNLSLRRTRFFGNVHMAVR